MALNEPNADRPERDRWLDQLYPHTGLEEPRPELDAAIQAAARREVGARPRALGARLRRWQLPVSIAAVVVISASIVILMREEGADRFEEVLAPKAMQEKAATVTPDGDADRKAKERTDAPARAQGPAPQTLPAPAVGLAAPSEDEARSAMPPERPPVGRIKPAESFPGEVRQRAADAANEANVRAPVPATEVPSKRPEPAAAGILSAPGKGPEAGAAQTEANRLGKRKLAKSERSLRDDRVSVFIHELEEAPPKEWLEKIDTLRRQGRDEEADDLLAEFRRRFPDHPVPHNEGARGN